MRVLVAIDKFKDALKEHNEEVPDGLAAIIFSKRQELCKYLTHKALAQSTDTTLLDYNFNIETVIASDSLIKVNEQLINLELILQCTDDIQRVTIEMNYQEASEFMAKLAMIESELMSASKQSSSATPQDDEQ